MRVISNKEKVEILKDAKNRLINSLRDSGSHECICYCIWYVLEDMNISSSEEFGNYIPCQLIQRRFEMNLVKPNTIDNYWWSFDNKGFNSRKKAMNILIKHFQSKVK